MTRKILIGLFVLAAFAALLVVAVINSNPREDGEGIMAGNEPQPRQVVTQSPVMPYPLADHVDLHTAGQDPGAEPRRLTTAERLAIEATLVRKTYDQPPEAVMACGEPSHFFRYVDAAGEQIGEMSVDFCNACVGFEPELGGGGGEIEFLYEELKTVVEAIDGQAPVTCGGSSPPPPAPRP